MDQAKILHYYYYYLLYLYRNERSECNMFYYYSGMVIPLAICLAAHPFKWFYQQMCLGIDLDVGVGKLSE